MNVNNFLKKISEKIKSIHAVKKKCFLFGFVGLYSVCMAVVADDTEIYFGNSNANSSSIQPNILFVLDTSGSMRNEVEGTGKSRLENMKEALTTLISNTNNVNFGLMRFNAPGGPILYPVTDIDAVVPEENSGEISVRVSNSSDDALQWPGSGEVVLDSDFITMTEASTATYYDVVLEIESDDDDAEERKKSHNLSKGGNTLGMMFENREEQLIGLRFRDIPLKKTSEISSAVIEFTKNNNSNSNDLEIYIQAEKGGDTGDFDDGPKMYQRSLTSKKIVWDVGPFNSSNKLTTVDVSDVIREVMADSGWSDEEAITFILSYKSGNGKRGAKSRDKSSSSQPKLKLSYSDGGGSGAEKQTVGLRFQDVGIPKGVTIKSASLEFVAAQGHSQVTSLTLAGEATGSAMAFSATNNDLSSRTLTSAKSNWVPGTWETGDTVQSADISALVQEMVNHSDWCGYNPMAFIITGSGKRVAESFDNEASSAPLLRVTYDSDSVPSTGTCINKTYSYRVLNSSDDAEQRSGRYRRDSSDLEMTYDSGTQDVGIRFSNVDIAQGATIESAYLEFTAKDGSSNSTSLMIYGHDVDDSPTFGSSSNKVYGRTKTSASTSWSSIPSWSSNSIYESPDISGVVQEIVNRSGWSSGNGMSFIITGSGKRKAYSMDGNASKAPRLVIKSTSTTSENINKTTRDSLLEIVSGLKHGGATPIVSTFYEAATYYRGETVDFGAYRGTDAEASNSSRQEFRVSAQSSWDTSVGSVVRASNCSEGNLSSSSCISEKINGSPSYISPITQSCQKNHIVILTDGQATVNGAESKIKSMTGISSCDDSGDEACGPELARWLYSTDQSDTISGTQNITTHTIGFNFTGDWLTSLSTNGGGTFNEASTASDLEYVFKEIVGEALKINSTFVAPAAAINQFSRLNHLNDIFFSVFRPGEDSSWVGNLKRYRLSGSGNDIVDSNGNTAVDDNTGFFKDGAKSYWSTQTDGADVAAGGAAENLPEYSIPRKTYTYTGSNVNLTNSSNAVHLVGGAFNSAITKSDLGDGSMSDDYREKLLRWMAGEDVLDEDANSTTLSRMSMSDPLHSKPVVFTHGGTEESPNRAILFGTNDGHFRAVNVDNGEQLWSFIPPELLPVSKTLFDNSLLAHPYGVDGAPLLWVNDPDFNGVSVDLSGTDNFAYVYFGMRRGGRHYYAMDVTDISEPKMLWRIQGGVGDFVELGQSWSRPVRTKVKLKVGSSLLDKDVLIFSGGYDENQDDSTVRTVDSMGRAMFIVDAKTGGLIWSGGPTSTFTQQFSEMNYSMPASPAVTDINLDGYADQIYIGDTGGQVWRFDISNGSLATDLVRGGVIANIAADSSLANARRFYHTPELSILTKSSGAKVLGIFVGSGFHAHPLDVSVDDRFYMIETSHIYTAPSSYTTVTESNLYDATDNVIAQGTASEKAAALLELNSKNGWRIDLPNTGEKVLSSPLVIEGQVVFTTYEPKSNTTGCVPQPGTTREYVMNTLDATPSINLNEDFSSSDSTLAEILTAEDRSRALDTGSIVDEPVVIFTEEGGGSTFLGTAKGSINIGKDRLEETFWYQEED